MKTDTKQKLRVPFSRSYWVVPGKLMTGYYPGSSTKDKTSQKLKGLLNHGIRYFIDLMEPDEVNRNGKPFIPYAPMMKSIAENAGVEATFDRMAIKDVWVPTKPEMRRVLDRIEECVNDDKLVYVHCLDGKGCTGTVVGCFLARHEHASGDILLIYFQKRERVLRTLV